MSTSRVLVGPEQHVKTFHDGKLRLYGNGAAQLGHFWISRDGACNCEYEHMTVSREDGTKVLRVTHDGNTQLYRYSTRGWLEGGAPDYELGMTRAAIACTVCVVGYLLFSAMQ
jgi:hypothetical protein